MKTRQWVALGILCASAMLASTSQAGPFRRGPAKPHGPHPRTPRATAFWHHLRMDPRLEYRVYRAYANDMYPKWNGAIHAREIQNLGVPSGDIGLRGNGITYGAW